MVNTQRCRDTHVPILVHQSEEAREETSHLGRRAQAGSSLFARYWDWKYVKAIVNLNGFFNLNNPTSTFGEWKKTLKWNGNPYKRSLALTTLLLKQATLGFVFFQLLETCLKKHVNFISSNLRPMTSKLGSNSFFAVQSSSPASPWFALGIFVPNQRREIPQTIRHARSISGA